MLMDKEEDFKENRVYSIKMVSGEELVAKVVKVTPEMITVSKPTVLAMGDNGMVLAPYMLTMHENDFINTSKVARIPRASIMMYGSPREDLETSYIKTTTGVDVAATPKIIM